MANVSDGQNPGRSSTPQRQPSSGAKRQGRGESGIDPTNQLGQTPSEIFGFPQHYSTGAPGSSGGSADADVTIEAGQLDDGLAGVTREEITSTGLHGSQGAAANGGGGTSVRYTDPFGYQGNVHREAHASGNLDGPGDWTTSGADNGFSGPTLPGLEGNRPTDTGVGKGHVGVKHPNAGQ